MSYTTDVSSFVCTRKQSKRLKELGVAQSSLFWHTQDKTPTNPNVHYYGWSQESMPWIIYFGQRSLISTSNIFEEYQAYTSEELGNLLPRLIYTGNKSYRLTCKKYDGWWCIDYVNSQKESVPFPFENCKYGEGNEAEQRATILIYLIENKLI